MVTVEEFYEGDLRCSAKHGPSGAELRTDAPKDNQGRGESFSPTDLVATALGTCMLTTMGIVAKRHGWPLEGGHARVEKHMIADPHRRIEKLVADLTLPAGLPAESRAPLEQAARGCPVARSIHPSTTLEVHFRYEAIPAAR